MEQTMEVENSAKEEIYERFRILWIAYIRLGIFIASLYGVYYLLVYVVNEKVNFTPNTLNIITWVIIALVVLKSVFFVINTLFFKSVVLYADDDGVWVYISVFPRSKGFYGIKWRGIDEALFVAGFVSLLLRNYSFAKGSEIILNSVYKGHEAVIHVNEPHKIYSR
ncbi:MAG: hypothetical protein LBP40_00705 [Campylobacteraceae bacterium]|jgi:hypothetical protein|nr:hypothetical protein [Campylobacteraceae bacterium]